MIYLFIFLGTLLEGELSLAFIVYVVLKGEYSYWPVLSMSALGAVTGDCLSFWIGGNHGVFLSNKFPVIARSTKWVYRQFGRFPFVLILFFRFQIAMRTFAFLSLGMQSENRARDLFFLFISCWVWSVSVLYLLDMFMPFLLSLWRGLTG